MFYSDAYTLKVSYDEAAYKEEKERLAEKYEYQEEQLRYLSDDPPKDPEFQVDTFDFKVLSTKEYDLNYPKKLIFIGTSDEKKEIAYIYFLDYELDSADSLEYILRSFCGWK